MRVRGMRRSVRAGGGIVAVWLLLLAAVPVGAAPPLAFTAPATAPSPLAAGESPWKIAVADMNGDTFLDLVTTFRGSGTNGRKASVFLATVSAGAVTGYTRADYVVGRSQRSLAVGDLNGDGKPDFVTGTSGGSCSSAPGGGPPFTCDTFFSVFLSTTDAMGNVTGYTRTEYPGMGNTALPFVVTEIAIADMDGDGRQDIVIAGGGTVRVYLASPTTTFTSFTDYSVVGDAFSMALRDLNGDGKPDIATANSDSSSSITVLRSTIGMMGNVTGYTRTDYAGGSAASGLAIADLNGDGRLDLATTNTSFSGAGTLRVLLDDGIGGYTTATQAISTQPNDVAVADMNGDGVLDLVVPNFGGSSGNSVSVLLNSGSGTSYTRTNFAAGSSSAFVVVADLTKDGTLDIAVTNNISSGTVTILFGTVPTALAATAGTPQAVLPNASYPTALSTTVRDASSRPLASIAVTFTIPAPGTSFGAPGGLFPMGATGVSMDRLSATVSTNATGVAVAPTITAGTVAGIFTVTARVQDVASTAPFPLTVNPGMAVLAQPFGGDNQTITVDTAAALPLRVRVTDAFGNARSGDTVTFTVNPMGGAGGTFAGGMTTATATTDMGGIAVAPAFTANGTAGGYTVVASNGAAMAAFSLTNATIATDGFALSGLPAGVTAGSAQMLTVTALNRSGATATGYAGTVAFTSSDPQATLPPNSTLTGGTGTFPVALRTAGRQTVTATDTTTGVITRTAVVMVAPAAANTLTAQSGGGQTVGVNTPLNFPLVARVTDAFGNPVANVMVTFFAPVGPLGGTFAPSSAPTRVVLTDANGIATAPSFTASGMAGMYTVLARAEGVVGTATFALTNGVVNTSPPPRIEAPPSPMPIPGGTQPREIVPMPPGGSPNPLVPRR